MGLLIESDIWEPNPFFYVFLCLFCFFSILLFPYFANTSSCIRNTRALFNLGGVFSASSASFIRFQMRFLLVYSLASVIEGLESVFGEFEYGYYYGLSREQQVVALSFGCVAQLLVGTFLGVFSDVMGHKKMCILFCVLHFFVAVLKSITNHSSIWIPVICLAAASSISSFSFEAWMVAEHEKSIHRKELLSETFWLMTFSESASFIGSQALANFSVKSVKDGISFPSTVVCILSMICGLYISREWDGNFMTSGIWSYKREFSSHILSDKRILVLLWSQACLHFSVAVFWILWASTVVADGREVHLAMIYPCFLGARMLGSSTVPWFISGPLSILTEDCLIGAYSVAGFALAIVAYDYQEIDFLVTLFCIFHACVGLILPSLARLRTMLVPIKLRAGMMSLSLAPANAAILFVLIQGGYYRSLGNSTIIALSAMGLLSSAGCMYLLKHWRKEPLGNWHKF